jgi:hypothetical protein
MIRGEVGRGSVDKVPRLIAWTMVRLKDIDDAGFYEISSFLD